MRGPGKLQGCCCSLHQSTRPEMTPRLGHHRIGATAGTGALFSCSNDGSTAEIQQAMHWLKINKRTRVDHELVQFSCWTNTGPACITLVQIQPFHAYCFWWIMINSFQFPDFRQSAVFQGGRKAALNQVCRLPIARPIDNCVAQDPDAEWIGRCRGWDSSRILSP